MRTVPKWVNKIHEADKVEFSSVLSICFSPDGTQLVIGAGEKVMIYDPKDGSLIQLLQAHKGTVHAVAYSGDGKKFASGSADKNVIIWTSKMEGVLKYSHSESIQCLAYNPITYQLASCASSDFAFWSAEVKAVQKHRVAGRITCCAWSPNGQFLAVGTASGLVSIRDKTGDEVQRMNREAAVWAVAFNNSTLLVTDWNETISFYNLQGNTVLKERNIGVAALSVAVLGELVLVGGAGGWCVLTSEGVPIMHTDHEWVWSVAPCALLNTMAVACQDGTLWCYQVVFSTVHGLYRERYAYRENMSDVIIQHLTGGSKVRIKCHDRVQKIAIYKHRLAVQLPERVVVYEQDETDSMLYRVKEKLTQKEECSLLVATSDALLLCQDTKLMMIGRKLPMNWVMPSPIRYVKVTTLYLEEVLLLGLQNGQIWRVDPVQGTSKVLLQTAGGVRCLDVSASRDTLAVVDDMSVCRVYSLPTQRLLFSEENVTAVSCNSWCDDLICLSGGGQLSIKAGRFPAAAQPLVGSVVGFQGGRVFCLQSNAMQTINVPLSHAVHQYVQHKMFTEAYAVACLGVTALDWERLGMSALEALSLEVARNAFQRSENVIFLNFIDHLQERIDNGENRSVVLADVLSYRGRYNEAARAYSAIGRQDKALDLYVDLRMFNKAQELVSEGDAAESLAQRRAQWARHVTSPRAAAQMYLAAGDVEKATSLLAENGQTDMLMELARKLDKGSSESLRHVAKALAIVGEHATAAGVYQRLGDYRNVAQLAIACGEWSRAFALAREHPECKRDVYLPYAHQMARENKFVEAQKAYHMAGETETAMRVFSILVNNAIKEERFSDAGYLHSLMAEQSLDTRKDNNKALSDYALNDRLARVYHAYENVHRSVHEPFSSSQPDTLINAARYVLALLDDADVPGVSKFCLYLCLAKQSKSLNANVFAKQMLDKIQGLQVPSKFQESIELLTLKSRCFRPSSDEEVALLCWRCRRHQPPLVALKCTYCGHMLAHSMATHEVLPLVEFVPAEGVSLEEALALIDRVPLPSEIQPKDEVQVLKIDAHGDTSNPFLDKVDEDDDTGVVVCGRQALLDMSPASVIIVRPPEPLQMKFYKNMLPELSVTSCPQCLHLFYAEDYEVQLASKGHCPFCRRPKEMQIKESDSNLESPTTPDSEDEVWR